MCVAVDTCYLIFHELQTEPVFVLQDQTGFVYPRKPQNGFSTK